MFRTQAETDVAALKTEYEHADRQRQLEISAQITDAQRKLALAEVDYKANLAWYNKEMTKLEDQKNTITKEYNDAKALLEEHSQYIQQQKVDLEKQSLEWQKTYDSLNLQISAAKVKNETLRTQLLGYEQQFEILKYNDTGRDLNKSTVIRNLGKAFGDTMYGLSQILNLPAIGGRKDGPKKESKEDREQDEARSNFYDLFNIEE